ncbi:MAG TPA: DUF5312 family protein [Spirochaetota bacterium]|nr:DUF5312 family protein [Spirochaetota bacterium]HOL57152.1 DUF5312 family protein [Spirochaetota bacterium]HPP03908.1 DUF5312 family protein [Spirochaetota bacterium]
MDFEFTSTNFEKLARELTEEERKNLLNKLKDYKTDSKEEETHILENKKNNKKDQETLAKTIYKKNGIFYKLFIIILSFFSGKNKYEVVIENELNNIKREINLTYYHYVNFSEEKFTSNFIKEILPVIKICSDLLPIFNRYFSDNFYYYGFIANTIEKNFPDKIKNAMDMTLPENLENRVEFIDKMAFFKERDNRLKKFFLQLNLMLFESMSQQVNKFELLIRLVNFNFNEILTNFLVENIAEPIKNSNVAKFSMVEDVLHKFYRIINSINFSFEEIGFIMNLIEYSKENPPNNEQNKDFDENTIQKIKELLDLIKIIKEKIPFKLIFQYLYKNIMYKPQLIKIENNILEIYKEYKRTLIEKLWNKHFISIRKNNLNFLISNFIKDYNFETLEFFTIHLKDEIEKTVSTKLFNVHLINFIIEFLQSIYKIKIEPVINRILIDGIFKKDNQRANLSVAYYFLNNYLEKIREFDVKFSEEKELGKRIFLAIKRISSEPNFKTALINLVSEINGESSKIKNELYETFKSILEFLEMLIDFNNPTKVPLTNFDKVRVPGYPNSFIAVEKSINYLNDFFKIIKLIEEVYI